jgi:two-component system, chemotaxis family, sensor kinase CheA
VEAEEREKGIEMVHGAPVHRLRGRLLPLVYLERELRLTRPQPSAPLTDGPTNIVVVQADGREFGLVVDEITDTEEIVVKPMGKHLKGISAYSGATIMGDGRVALILDILGLAQRAKVISEARESALSENENTVAPEEDASQRRTLLLVQCGAHARMAIPLSMVARLEEFPQSAVELAGAQEVTQYRGQIMPLIHLSRMIADPEKTAAPDASQSPLQVVVYSESGRSVGLVVDHILDIVDESLSLQNPAERHGVLGSSVIQKRVTDLLDIASVVRDAIPSFDHGPREQA